MYHQPEPESQRQSRYALRQLLETVVTFARRTTRFAQKKQQAVERQERFEKMNPDLNNVGLMESAGYLLLLLFLPVVYLIDYILFSATAEYFAHQNFPGSPWMIVLARAVIPAGFLLIEVAISIQLYFARRSAAEFGNARAKNLWIALGVLFALVMPTQVMATLLASRPAHSSANLSLIFNFQLIGLVSLVLVAHLAVLFGGWAAYKAKAYLVYKLKMAWLRFKISYFEKRNETEADKAAKAFSSYVDLMEVYKSRTSLPIEAGPFDKVTADLLKERYGNLPMLSLPESGESSDEKIAVVTKARGD